MDALNCTLSLIATFFFFLLAARFLPATKKPNLPPGPKPFPVIGNFLDLGDKPQRSLASLAKTYGPLMTLKLGQLTTVVVSSAAMAREVLQTHDQILSSRVVPDAVTAYDHHQFTLPMIPISTRWRNLRRICNNRLFSGKILDDNASLRRKKVEELVADVGKSARDGEAVEIGLSVFATTLNLVSNTVFSVDLAGADSEMAREFRSAVRGMMVEMGKPNVGDYFPVVKKMDLQGIRKRISVHIGKLLDLMDQMIDERLQMQNSPDFAPKNDFLHHLLNLGEESKDINLDRNEIRHFLLMVFVASTDTTTSTTQWAMAYLLHNPHIMSKAKAELKLTVGDGNPVEESHVDKLPYLQAIIKETLRLRSAFILPRLVTTEITMGGYTIPKNAQIMVNLWALGRDPDVWEDPDVFKPERFMEMEFDIRGRNFELVPFGGGRRICPGIPLASRMLHLMVGSLVHWFDWKLEDGVSAEKLNMDEKFGIVLDMAYPIRAVPVHVTSTVCPTNLS